MPTDFVANQDHIQIKEITEADIPDFRDCLDAVTRERRYATCPNSLFCIALINNFPFGNRYCNL